MLIAPIASIARILQPLLALRALRKGGYEPFPFSATEGASFSVLPKP